MERQNYFEPHVNLTEPRRRVLEAYWSLASLAGRPEGVIIEDLKALRLNGGIRVPFVSGSAETSSSNPTPKLEAVIGDMTISLNTQRTTVRVSLSGESNPASDVPLTPKEFLFLKMLMADPLSIVTPEQLRERMWPEQSDKPVRHIRENVRVCATKLRKQLGATEKNPIIYNIRGFGYSLTPRMGQRKTR